MSISKRGVHITPLHPWLCLLGLLSVACRDESALGSAKSSVVHALEPAAGVTPPRRILPYPRARWRLASPAGLANVAVWLSHILIRHRDADNHEVPFSLADWSLEQQVVSRSRDEALALAQHVQQLAAADPSSFARVAAQYSEDTSNNERGGTLGGMRALELSPWPRLLDAVAALSPGQVSEVVESHYGFHILLREPPPDDALVSGSHIVISYDGARWLREFLARRELPSRSRAEALALAQHVYSEAAADPSRFEQLMQEYSEHQDVVQQGDLGEWSTRRASYAPREVSALRRVAVGQVVPPLDTLLGFQVLLRTPHRARGRYAAQMISFGFNLDAAASEPTSREMVLLEAREVLEALRRQPLVQQPETFAEYQNKYCCRGVVAWEEGQQAARLAHAVATTSLNEINPELVEAPSRFIIVRRVEAPPESSSKVVFDLPSPEEPDLPALIGQGLDTEALVNGLREVAEEVGISLQLGAEKRSRLVGLHDLSALLSEPSVRPDAALAELDEQVRRLLGAADHLRYRRTLNAHFESLILNPPAH